MDDTATSAANVRVFMPPRWRTWLRRGALAILLFCLAGGAYVFYFFKSAEYRLQQTLAELDRRDPGWRLEELEARRKVIPPEVNSAFQVRAALALRTAPWPAQQARFEYVLRDLAPHTLLPEQDDSSLRTELKKAQPALAEARKLADLPTGRFPIAYSSDGISTLLPDVQNVRDVGLLLRCDALVQCQDGHMDAAVLDCRAMLNTGRSLNDEPLGISQLIRLACRDLALRSLERTLAQGQPSEASLALLQELLEDEDKQPVFLIVARSERAFADRMLQALQTANAKPSQFGALLIRRLRRLTIRDLNVNDFLYQTFGSVSEDRAALLDFTSQAVEIAKSPVEEQGPRLNHLGSTLKMQREMVQMMCPSVTKLAEGIRRSQARLRSAIADVAVERYRQAHRGWPESLAALVPKYLARLPRDPSDGGPLHYRRLADHVVIYSPGFVRQDGGGDGASISMSRSGDVGFRLWEVNRRRQQPTPWSALRVLLWKPLSQ
jgi:hypothetical protein